MGSKEKVRSPDVSDVNFRRAWNVRPDQSDQAAEIAELTVVSAEDQRAKRLNKIVDIYEQARKEASASQQAYMQMAEALQTVSEGYIPRLRDIRMSFSSELNQIITALNDVKRMLGSPDHEQSIIRLKEFADVLERLKALKESGFLDAVADTILRLDGVKQ